jgi:hypothetical protein
MGLACCGKVYFVWECKSILRTSYFVRKEGGKGFYTEVHKDTEGTEK